MRRMCSTRSSRVSTWPYIMVAVVEIPRRCASRMIPSHSAEVVFFGEMTSRTRSTRISAAAAGDRVEPGVAQARQRLGDRAAWSGGRRAAPPAARARAGGPCSAHLIEREEILVVVDPEIGMVAALHEQAGAAERERLLDLLEDHRLRQQVALAPVTGTAVEGAEVAVRVADVRVVQVAVDDEGDAARVGPARPALVGDPADRDELARAQQRQRVLIGDPLAGARLLEDLTDRPVAVHRLTLPLGRL